MKILENYWVKLIFNVLVVCGFGFVAYDVIMLCVNDHLGILSASVILISLITTLAGYYEEKE